MTRVVFVLTILAVLFPNLGEGAELALEARLRILDQDRAPQGYIRPRQPFFLEAVLELEEDWPGEPPQVGLKVFDQGTLLMEVEGLGEVSEGTVRFRSPSHAGSGVRSGGGCYRLAGRGCMA